MLITKKESKDLRYFARANYKSAVTGVDTENGKIKHREFPCFGLSYDEAKADKGKVELTNVIIEGKPFDGDYDDLMARLREILDSPVEPIVPVEPSEREKETCECLLHGPECKQEPLPKGPSIVQRIMDTSDEVVTSEKPGDIIKETLKGMYPEGTQIDVDVKPTENRIDVKVTPSVHSVKMLVKVEPVKDPQEPEQKTIEVTGAIVSETHDSGRDYSGLSEEAIAEAYKSVVGEDIGTMKPSSEVAVEEFLDYLATHEPPPLEVAPLEEPQELPVVENVEEAKKTAEETGKPVITAVQKPKKTRAELYDLQIKCATMKLATSYKEPPDTDIGWLMKKYPDAVEKLNALYAADGIKTYTITEEAIKKAYPDEYAVLCP